MTTVGFGDKLPRTLAGRIIAGMTMMAGILVIALPVAIVGSRFQEVYNDIELQNRMKREKDAQDGLIKDKQQELENESLLYEKINEHPALSALARRVKRRLQRLRASVDDSTASQATSYSDAASAKAFLAKLEPLAELHNEKVLEHVTNLRSLIDLSLKHEEVLRHLEERESYLQSSVQHQYEDVMKHLDGTFFPWPKRPGEVDDAHQGPRKDRRFMSESKKT